MTPDGWGTPLRPPNTSGYSAEFTVINSTTGTLILPIYCWGTGEVTCTGTNKSSVTLRKNRSTTVLAYYSVGAAGSDTLKLKAGDVDGDYDTGWYRVHIGTPPVVTIVSPGADVGTRTPVVRITFEPGSPEPQEEIDTSATAVTWGGTAVTQLGRANERLFELEIPETHRLSPGQAKTLSVTVCSLSQRCTTDAMSVTLPTGTGNNKPILSGKAMPLEALGRQFSAPFGPGFAVAGADVETSVGTPAYVSLNQPRSAGLTYSSRQSYPRALVNVDLEFPGSLPSSLTMRLLDGGTVVDSFVQSSPSCSTGAEARCRVSLQADFLGLNGNTVVRKWLTVEAVALIAGEVHTTADSVEVVLVDRRTTPYGSGWWPSGLMRLVIADSDAIIVASDGTATVYRGHADRFIAPPGSRLSLRKVGTTYELTGPGPTPTITFDAQGWQTEIWRGPRVLLITYDANGVYRLQDAVGKYLQFNYSGGKLASITDPGGRATTFTISSNRLTTVAPPAGPGQNLTQQFGWHTYSGSAVLVKYRRNSLGDSTTVIYDAALRPYKVIMPTVKNESGVNVQPTVHYYAQELKGLHATASLDSVAALALDPATRWTRSTLNRWGQVRKTWDALGTLGVNTYTEAGLLLTSEGKVGDSTRVYYTYDADDQLVRTHRLRTGGAMLRLDSLVYTNGYVTKRVDTFGNTVTTSWDWTCGLPATVASSLGDTTTTRYDGYCLADSSRVSGVNGWTRYTFDGTWHNTATVIAPDGTIRTSNTYDSLGRLVETQGKITVQETSATTQMQWRRRILTYTPANQVVVTRVERTDNCAAPCSTPTWPSAADTVKVRLNKRFYTAVGLDSAITYQDTTRLTGGAEVVARDALGRVVQRWPTGTFHPSEALRYDVAGNLRYRVTRRGHTLETQYDARHRVSRRLLGPTVGSFTYVYGGPNDELTAITADAGFADPVGGSNVNARWGYNNAGLLVSDTVQGTRVTAYAHDAYDRVAQYVDAIGTWSVRYHAQRGTPDTLVTPHGDRVYYVLDSLGRVAGPWIDGSGTDFARTQTWRSNGALGELTNDHGYVVGHLLVQDWEDPEPPQDSLAPRWTERYGSGGAQHTGVDSLTYDGWQRVTRAVYLTDGVPVDTQVFNYRRTGDLSIDGQWTFDGERDQLTSGNGCSFSYDAAGNLTGKTCGSVTWTYTYDALDRLTHVTNTAGLSAAYTYDALGQRIAKKVDGAVTRFVWRAGHVVYETDGGGTLTLSYTWGMATDDLVAIHRHSPSAHYYVVQDLLRSVRALVDRAGTWQAAWRYQLYGATMGTAGSVPFPVRFRWAGAQYDEETGFYYLRARYYDPALGRFTQEDPIGRAGGTNLYAYAGGDPVKRRDPWGTADTYDPQYYVWQAPAWENGLSAAVEWEWIVGLWDVQTIVEQNATYAAYEKAWEGLHGAGVFQNALENAGKRSVVNQTRKLGPDEFGRLYSAYLAVKALDRTSSTEWLYGVAKLGQLFGTGRIAVNNAAVGDDAVMRMSSSHRILWVHSRNMWIYSTLEDLGFDLMHEIGHYYDHYKGTIFGTLNDSQRSADLFAAKATGWPMPTNRPWSK